MLPCPTGGRGSRSRALGGERENIFPYIPSVFLIDNGSLWTHTSSLAVQAQGEKGDVCYPQPKLYAFPSILPTLPHYVLCPNHSTLAADKPSSGGVSLPPRGCFGKALEACSFPGYQSSSWDGCKIGTATRKLIAALSFTLIQDFTPQENKTNQQKMQHIHEDWKMKVAMLIRGKTKNLEVTIRTNQNLTRLSGRKLLSSVGFFIMLNSKQKAENGSYWRFPNNLKLVKGKMVFRMCSNRHELGSE